MERLDGHQDPVALSELGALYPVIAGLGVPTRSPRGTRTGRMVLDVVLGQACEEVPIRDHMAMDPGSGRLVGHLVRIGIAMSSCMLAAAGLLLRDPRRPARSRRCPQRGSGSAGIACNACNAKVTPG